MARGKRWTAGLLCLLLIVQECSARNERYYPNIRSNDYLAQRDHHDFVKRSLNHRHDDFESLYHVYYTDTEQCRADMQDQYELGSRDKRIIPAILFGVSIVLMLANIGFDIYLKVEGCCQIAKPLCTYQEDFEDMKKQLKEDVDASNDQYTESLNIFGYIKSCNRLNGDIWLEVNRIMKLQERLIVKLDSSIINNLEAVSNRLKSELFNHNMTVISYNDQQIMTEYHGLFDNAKTAMIGLAPLIGMGGLSAITKGYKYYKTVKAANALKSSAGVMNNLQNLKVQKVMGIKNVNAYARSTVTAQGKAAAAASKFARIAKVAGVAMSVIAIGFEIWTAIKKVEGCKNIRDDAKKAVDELQKEIDKVDETKKDLVEFKKNVTGTFAQVKGQLTAENTMNYYLILEKIAKGAANSPAYLVDAGNKIAHFHDNIMQADTSQTYTLQNTLVTALQKIKYTYECYSDKVSTVTYVYDKCKAGLHSIRHTYDYAVKIYEVNTDDCTLATGEQYTSFAETDKYVGDRLVNEGLQKDCVLNNYELFKISCLKYVEGYNNEDIAKSTSLELAQVEFFVAKCPPGVVSPKIQIFICGAKAGNNLQAVLKLFNRYDAAAVEKTYDECPKPKMESFVKGLVCQDKTAKKMSLHDVLDKYSQYDTSEVTEIYHACQWPQISANDKNIICAVKNNGMEWSYVLDLFSKYKQSDVKAAWDAC